MYVNICVYAYIYIYIYIYTYEYVNVHIYMCVYVGMYICIYVCVDIKLKKLHKKCKINIHNFLTFMHEITLDGLACH